MFALHMANQLWPMGSCQESSMAVRLWTSGWDFFAPTKACQKARCCWMISWKGSAQGRGRFMNCCAFSIRSWWLSWVVMGLYGWSWLCGSMWIPSLLTVGKILPREGDGLPPLDSEASPCLQGTRLRGLYFLEILGGTMCAIIKTWI